MIILAKINLHPVDLAGEPAVARAVVRSDRGAGLVSRCQWSRRPKRPLAGGLRPARRPVGDAQHRASMSVGAHRCLQILLVSEAQRLNTRNRKDPPATVCVGTKVPVASRLRLTRTG